MKVVVLGARGGLGSAVCRIWGENHDVIGLGSTEVDITREAEVRDALGEHRPEVLVNCAAFTNVDGCVSDYTRAYAVNAIGPLILANACRTNRIALMHVSTNEVFEGSRVEGYEEWMPASPINRYGMSKAAGEFNIRTVLPDHYIVRTAWLMSAHGRNFVHAILRRAESGEALRVVTDEIGNPTFVDDLAEAMLGLLRTGCRGTYHLVNEGMCSRWEFANEILKQTGLDTVENVPITGSEFQRASTPPVHGGLCNCNAAALDVRLRPWQEGLAALLCRLGRKESFLSSAES